MFRAMDRGNRWIREKAAASLNPPQVETTLVHRVAGSYKNENDVLNTVRTGFDYCTESYVDCDHFSAAERFLNSSQIFPHVQDHIVTLVDQANRSYSEVESRSPSLLILNEWFTPAWKVRVNGKNQLVMRINEWQTGVLLDAGKNRVEFEYRPTLFRMLMLLNRITILSLLFFAVFGVLRNRLATSP